MNKRIKMVRAGIAVMLAVAPFSQSAAQNNPVANPKAIVTSGNARFTMLTPEMIRIEYSEKGQFEDCATFTIVNRRMDLVDFKKKEDSEFLYIQTDKLKLKYRKGANPKTIPASPENLTITLDNNGCETM